MPGRVRAAQASSDSDRSNDWFAARLSLLSFPARRDFFQSVGRAKPGNSPFAARRAPRTVLLRQTWRHQLLSAHHHLYKNIDDIEFVVNT